MTTAPESAGNHLFNTTLLVEHNLSTHSNYSRLFKDTCMRGWRNTVQIGLLEFNFDDVFMHIPIN